MSLIEYSVGQSPISNEYLIVEKKKGALLRITLLAVGRRVNDTKDIRAIYKVKAKGETTVLRSSRKHYRKRAGKRGISRYIRHLFEMLKKRTKFTNALSAMLRIR